ncbi:hypothetical protein BDFB_007292, partial [Asbolus verrucosus]
SPHNDTDTSVTPTNIPKTPPIEIPVRTVNPSEPLDTCSYAFVPISKEKSELSPISGSFDYDFRSDVDSPLTLKSPEETVKSRPESATNELPLTELNLALFTSEQETLNSSKMSTNELPLSDIKLSKLTRQNTVDSQNDDISLEVNWEADFKEDEAVQSNVKNFAREKRHRSFSDPNILDGEKLFLLEKYNESLARDGCERSPKRLSPGESPRIPFSFYPQHAPPCSLCCNTFTRSPSNLLSFFSSPPRASRSLSNPSPGVSVNHPCMSDTECNNATVRRHRHSIAGQMSYYKMLGFGCGGPLGFKKLAAGSGNSLFSTAVISGSSSAPNLRDMIPSTASASAIEGFGGVPPIRPLETLHNALSLKQIDTFLDQMTAAPLFRTPSSTPPKYPSTPLPTPTNGSQTVVANAGAQPLKLQSPSNNIFIIGESGDVTPVSGGSEVEFNTNDATAGSTAECDVTDPTVH